jgi:signal transduction histidine kinase
VTARSPAPPHDTPETWMAALSRVMERITADADSKGLPAALAAGLAQEFGVAVAAIWLYDPADDALHLRASHGLGGSASYLIRQIPARAANTPIVQRLMRGEVVLLDHVDSEGGLRDLARLRRQGVRGYAGFPLRVGDRFVGVMSIFTGATCPPMMIEAVGVLAQQAALALDHARVIEESHTLQGVAAEIASARDVGALLDGIVQRTMAALGAEACTVWLIDEHTGRLMAGATRGLSPAFLHGVQHASYNTGAFFSVLRHTRQPLFSRDARAEARTRDQALAALIASEGIVSALRLPLFEPGGEVAGMLALYHRRERLYSDSEVRLAQAFTDQVAVALHNARLAEREREAQHAATRQVERLTTFTQITEQLLGTTDLDAVLRVVTESASRLCDARGSVMVLLDEARRRLTVGAFHGPMDALVAAMHGGIELDDSYLDLSATGQALTRRETVVVENYATWPPSRSRDATLAAGIQALVAAPLLVGGEPIGVLWVNDTRARSFAPEDVGLVQALADQAALAITHARLVRRGQDAAVLEERARLARDLHDSVTQSVFSLGMMARAAQTQHARGADGLGSTLERMGTLAQEALAEMRALLFELRPAALAEEGLAVALERLVTAVRARMEIPVSYSGACQARPAPETETAIFRIVQEALNNAAKHARARSIAVTLTEEDGRLAVTVVDDGIGFDPGGPAPHPAGLPPAGDDSWSGGLGMASMRERAAAAGLNLRISSAPGAGTTVLVEAVVMTDG